ncbi:MAG: enterochelin esterase, partial [Stellaceae bacterium]
LCYLPDTPAVLARHSPALRTPSSAGGSRNRPEGSGKVINALATAASYDPDPTQFLGIRLPVTFDTCEVVEER